MLLEMLLLAAVVGGVYAAGLDAPPLFDDDVGVVDNPRLRDPGRLLRYALNAVDADARAGGVPNYAYRPLTEATFLLNQRFAGESLADYRVGNILIHILAACTILLILRHLAGLLGWATKGLPLLGALWFALHPFGVEAVTYVYQRAVSLEALLGFLCILGYLKVMNMPGGARRSWIYAGTLLSALLACGAKETAVTLPLILACLEWVLRKPGTPWSGVWRRWLPLAAVACVVPVQILRIRMSPNWEGVNPVGSVSPWSYLGVEGGVVWDYLGRYLLPVNLCFYHDSPSWPAAWTDWIPAAGIGLLLAWVVLGPTRQRVPRLALGWILASLALESSLFPIADVAFYHRCYPGLLGGALAFVWILDRIPRPLLSGSLVLACLGSLTVQENLLWRSPPAKLRRDVRGAPRVGKIRSSVAWDELDRDPARAARIFATAARGPRCNSAVLLGYARSLERLGRVQDALGRAHQAARLWPKDPGALAEVIRLSLVVRNRTLGLELAKLAGDVWLPSSWDGAELGYQLAELGQFEEAESLLKRTLRNNPASPHLWDNLGIVWMRQGRFREAEAAHQAALYLFPKLAKAHNNLAALYLAQDRPADAEREVREAIRLQPDYAMAWANLGILMDRQGRDEEARKARETAATCPPDSRLTRPPTWGAD